MKLYDITHPLATGTAPWPGDTAYQFDLTARIADGDGVNVSRITLSPHNGTHMDAPYHYDQKGLSMEKVPLERCIGSARVIAVEGVRAVTVATLRGHDLRGIRRLLIRTGSCPEPARFHPAFTHIDPDAIHYLASLGARLIGTDAHSLDPYQSQDLPAHHACARHGLLILENLNLAEVPTGDYELIALPLKLVGADASPVRAVLREMA